MSKITIPITDEGILGILISALILMMIGVMVGVAIFVVDYTEPLEIFVGIMFTFIAIMMFYFILMIWEKTDTIDRIFGRINPFRLK